MDGELSGRNVCRDGRQSQEEDDRREADEQIGEDELVAQAPHQMLVEQTPGQWNRQAEERQTDQKLHPAKQGAASAGRQAQQPDQPKSEREPEDRTGHSGGRAAAPPTRSAHRGDWEPMPSTGLNRLLHWPHSTAR
jgi:hypothetical protein